MVPLDKTILKNTSDLLGYFKNNLKEIKENEVGGKIYLREIDS